MNVISNFMSKKKFVCIHGHFYQPPRENPWLNEVELQESAYPFHDWNERITAECYARNSAARILNDQDQIIDIINNYGHISFNFGPTLLAWLEAKAPEVYEAILVADHESRKRFSGHGSALAQVYNHVIMPLANPRDQQTQVRWGIADFERRFGRKPEGMWLAETAADTASLEVMAEHGIAFTILSPYQARQVRRPQATEWQDVTGARVDPRRPYLCRLPSGRTISLFFYDGPVSQGIAFEGLLNDGQRFAQRLLGALDDDDTPQLMHIATDGESYGHHHRLGEMALSYCVDTLKHHPSVGLTVYGEYLENFPPEWEATIIEGSSWSCAHGVERWRSNCGCHTGGPLGGQQEWRGPLRAAFDFVRDQLAPYFEAQVSSHGADPWAVRNDYVQVILNRSRDNVSDFLRRHFGDSLTRGDQTRLLQLLEMQHHALLMYTSCGWFFDEVTGLEGMQDIFYAARAIQLARDLEGPDLEDAFVALLERAPSSVEEFGNAAAAYRKIVQPCVVDLIRVGAHYAVSSLFSEYPKKTDLYSYVAHAEHYDRFEAGKQKLALGKVTMRSDLTWEEQELSFAVLHLGDHHLFGGVRTFLDEETFRHMHDEMEQAFGKSNVHEVIVLLDKHFGTHSYSFWHLFRDEQKKILDQVLNYTFVSVEGLFRQIYENNFPIMQVLKEFSVPMPRHLKIPVDFVSNAKIRRLMREDYLELDELERVIKEVRRLNVDLDEVTLNYTVAERINQLMEDLTDNPTNLAVMRQIMRILHLFARTTVRPDLWRAQNLCFMVWRQQRAGHQQRADEGATSAQRWLEEFEALTAALNMKVERFVAVQV